MSQRLFDNLKVHLKTKSRITDKVGEGDDARIYKNRARQKVDPPYIVCFIFEGTSLEHLNGVSGLASNRVQIDCYADSSSAAFELSEDVRLNRNGAGGALQMFRGTFGELYIHGIHSEDGYREGEDPPEKGSDKVRFWVSRDYIINHSEPTE